MKVKVTVMLISSVMLTACGGESDDASSVLEPATIVSQVTEECYCCPGFEIEMGGNTYWVDDLPSNAAVEAELLLENFPIDVTLSSIAYTGTCPNKNLTILEIMLVE